MLFSTMKSQSKVQQVLIEKLEKALTGRTCWTNVMITYIHMLT